MRVFTSFRFARKAEEYTRGLVTGDYQGSSNLSGYFLQDEDGGDAADAEFYAGWIALAVAVAAAFEMVRTISGEPMSDSNVSFGTGQVVSR